MTKNLTYSEQDKMESTKEINRDLNRYKLEKEGSSEGFLKFIELDKRARSREGYKGERR